MNRDREKERLRDRYLENALREIHGAETPPDLVDRVLTVREAQLAAREEGELAESPGRGAIGFRRVRRVVLWPAAVLLAVALAILSLPGDPPPVDDPARVNGGTVTGVVRGVDGEVAADVAVDLVLGYADGEPLPGRSWLQADRMSTRTAEDGTFTFEGVPEDAVGTVFGAAEGAFGRAAADEIVLLDLEPAATIEGTVLARADVLGSLSIYYTGDGFRTGFPMRQRPDERGDFTVEGIPAGPGTLTLQWGNWLVARVAITAEAGRRVRIDPIRVDELEPKSVDPLVDAATARIVDEEGRPMEGVRLVWSARGADGASTSNDRGEIALAGGGVMIGPPPFLLRLQSLTRGEERFYGESLGVTGDVAEVCARPTRTVRGTAGREEGPVRRGWVYWERRDERVFAARIEDGTFTLAVPPGEGTLLVLTPRGVVHQAPFTVPTGDGRLQIEIRTD